MQQPLQNLEPEDQLKLLTDKDYHRNFRKQVEHEAGQLDTESWRKLRKLAKTDLFFLAYGVLGFNKLSTNLHGNLTAWMKATARRAFRLLLLPRGHYKSTIWTIADSIQAALPDDSGDNIWPYCLGPDIRICIMHEVQGTAAKFLSSIQNHFLSNVALMKLFPECIPDPRKQTMNMLQFELPRSKFWVEKTFEVMGVGGRSQGNHYNLLKPDDLIGKEAADSKIIMKSTIDWVDNIQSFLTSFSAGDKIDFTGTRWGHEDLYAHLEEIYGEELAVYKRAVEEKNLVTGKMESIFPEEYPRERLKILRKKPKIFSAQYLNDPSSAETELGAEKLQYYYWKNKKTFTVFDKLSHQNIDIQLAECHRMLLLDPADTGSIGITVTAVPDKLKIYVIEAIKSTFSTPKLISTVCDLIIKWNIKVMVVEKVVFSSLYEHVFITEFLKRNIKCKIIMQAVPRGTPGASRNEGKMEKLKVFSVYLDAFQIYINEGQTELYEEFRKFGTSTDVHLLDSLWLGTRHWRTYNADKDSNSPSSPSQFTRKLDQLSGYSSVK